MNNTTSNRSQSRSNSSSSNSRGFGNMDSNQHRLASSRGGQTTASRNNMSELGRRGGMARGRSSNSR